MFAYITLLVLLSGFIFTCKYPIARFKQLRSKGWNLYCHLFSWGVFWCSISYLVFLYFYSEIQTVELYLNSLNIPVIYSDPSVSFDIVILSVICILLSFCAGFLSSFFSIVKKQATKMVVRENDLKNKFYESTKRGEFLQISLSSRKVYIGIIIRNNEEYSYNEQEYIEIFPLRSGYRDESTLMITFTNEYTGQYVSLYKRIRLNGWYRLKKLVKKKKVLIRVKFWFKCRRKNSAKSFNKEMSRYTVIIPLSEIKSVSFFDSDVYKSINGNTVED